MTINGQPCTNFSAQPTERDYVKVDGKLVRPPARLLYLLLNKPAGFVSTRQRSACARHDLRFASAETSAAFHVGRLDAQSEGLILLTNDGDFAQRLIHPRHQIEKEYEVVLDRLWDPALTPKYCAEFFSMANARRSCAAAIGPASVRVVLRQGINRQIRRMFYDIGYEVKKLTRIRIGNLRLRDLPRGHWRALTRVEIDAFDSIQLGAQNRERRRVADAATGSKPNRNRKERHG